MGNASKLLDEYFELCDNIEKIHSNWRDLLKQMPEGTTLYELEKDYPHNNILIQSMISNLKKMSVRAKEKFNEFSKENDKELDELKTKFRNEEGY